MRYAFRIVDVFTDRPFAGNQLAVVLDAEGLDSEQMQAIASEFRLAETTFVTPSGMDGCDCRVHIFTPVQELPMAGHPTIGTAVVLESLGRVSGSAVFELGVGPTAVQVRPSWAEMEQQPPTFGPAHVEPFALADALFVDPDEIMGTGLPIQAVSTGMMHLLVPVRTLAAIRDLSPRPEAWNSALKDFGGMAVYAFTREVDLPGSDAHCRMFAPHLGIAEDAATGSAAGPLACYLALHTLPKRGDHLSFRFEQGFEIGRPSLLEASVERSGDVITAVRVGGSARIVAEGWLTVD